ncbi:MAG: endonuclease V [Bacteroidia bacterium]
MDSEHAAWAALQEEMARQVIIPEPGADDLDLKPGDSIFTLDVQYVGDTGYVAIDHCHWQGGVQQIFAVYEPVNEPYVPGYFAFREGPVLRSAIRKAIEYAGITPSLIIVDGHGTAHPRKFGVACWLGIELGLPTLGCAKETLVRYEGSLGEELGSTVDVTVEGEVVGYALRTAVGVKPVFVSPGHLISLAKSREVILGLAGGFRVVEPLRRADMACRSYAKGEHGIALTYLD